MAKAIMIQGTMSNAGKSLLAAGLCRIFKQDGYKVAPFKSQNMALNSFITKDGLEMGRAQVMQAEAAGIQPSVLMNPILLKPTNDVGSQVIVNGEVLGTRATKEQYALVKAELPQVQYDEISGILKIEREDKEHIGCIAVCTGGTADIPVAEEAAQTAEFFGNKVERIYDVGVAGIHRLLGQRERIAHANCIVAAAGMEGALGTVVAGLVENPVIAVPTSVGYGASFHGLSALLTMLNSCANGISVVNIDNGYGAGYLASQINRLAERKS